MRDQADLLRKMAWVKDRKANYVAISSGKGGVGKTNFAVNISYQMAKNGKKVLLFDADLGLANVDILLNIAPMKTVRDYLIGSAGVDEIIIKNVKGFDVFPASSGFLEMTELSGETFEKLIDMFMQLDEKYDYIIFDTAAGISNQVLRFILFSDIFIAITLTEPTAITDVYALIKVVHQANKSIVPNLVINMVDDNEQAKNIFENLKKVVSNFLKIRIKFLGSIKRDKNLLKAVAKQKIVSDEFPSSNYSNDLKLIVKKILSMNEKNRDIDMQDFLMVRK